ncbi:MAG: hypothetical protein IMZ69_00640 [Spirochaetes bacterium]|nr:hypothetical protein [Spirochaetota bacterium]
MSAPWPAPLWLFVWRHLAEILIGIRWDAAGECFVGDVDGREYRMWEGEPWAMIFATGERVDLVDWLASRKGKPRREIVAVFENARAAEMEPAGVQQAAGSSPYESDDAVAYADAGEFSRRSGAHQ